MLSKFYWPKVLDVLYSQARVEYKLIDVVQVISLLCTKSQKKIIFSSCRKLIFYDHLIFYPVAWWSQVKSKISSSNLEYRCECRALSSCTCIGNSMGFFLWFWSPHTIFVWLAWHHHNNGFVHVLLIQKLYCLAFYAPMPYETFNWIIITISNKAQAFHGFYMNLINREDLKLLIVKSMLKPFILPHALPSKFFLILPKHVKPACDQTHDWSVYHMKCKSRS